MQANLDESVAISVQEWASAIDLLMTVSAKACVRAMAAIERVRMKHRALLVKLNARHRVWTEQLRAAHKKEARQMIRKEFPVVAKTKGTGPSAKVKTTDKRGRGRPARWPGLCHACMRRHAHLDGGPKHMTGLCERTQSYIRKLKV